MMTFGVLFSNADNLSQREMWRGINDFALKNNINLVAYMGSYQSHHDNFTSHFETCFEEISNSKFLDGVILFSGYISHLIGGDDVYESYVKRIPKNIPCVSLAHIVPDRPSILVDNLWGMYQAVNHLIKVHDKRKIVFIKGPNGHQEAEERLLGYKMALADNGISFDEQYVLPGDFSVDGAKKASKILFDERKVPFDAVAASDDMSAVQFLKDFEGRGIKVPEDVAVTGFDDSRDAATSIPSVSTSSQDFYAMGIKSIQILMNIVNKESVDKITYIPSSFVARQSCGCYKRVYKKNFYDNNERENRNFMTFMLSTVLPLFPSDVPVDKVTKWVTKLTHLVISKPFDGQKFLLAMDETLISYSRVSRKFEVWHDVLKALMMATQRFDYEIENAREILETLLQATTLVNDIAENEDVVRENYQSDIRLALRRITSSLVLIFDIDVLAAELYRVLPDVDINMILVALYDEPIKAGNFVTARKIETVVGFDGEKQINQRSDEKNPVRFMDFSTIRSFDFDRERRVLFYLPLFFKDQELGAVVLPYDPEITVHAYETLRINISTAIKGAQLINKIQTLSITDELTGLLNRRGFFQFAYSRLDFIERHFESVPLILFLDMDGLKKINDSHGHKEGDRALKILANIIKQSLRKDDIIGRMGGDEFVVFSAMKSTELVNIAANRIRTKLDEYNAKMLHPYKIECSIGSIVLGQYSNVSLEEAIEEADKALYEEKMYKKRKLRESIYR